MLASTSLTGVQLLPSRHSRMGYVGVHAMVQACDSRSILICPSSPQSSAQLFLISHQGLRASILFDHQPAANILIVQSKIIFFYYSAFILFLYFLILLLTTRSFSVLFVRLPYTILLVKKIELCNINLDYNLTNLVYDGF